MLRFVRWSEETLRLIQMPNEPVRSLMTALHIETAAEGPARLKNPVGFPIRAFFVREGVEAVEGQHDIEAFILKR